MNYELQCKVNLQTEVKQANESSLNSHVPEYYVISSTGGPQEIAFSDF